MVKIFVKKKIIGNSDFEDFLEPLDLRGAWRANDV